jgi:hypothetical protein
MSRSEAEILARDIRQEAQALGLAVATKQEGGEAIVILTWRGNTIPIKTPKKWQTLRPTFIREAEKARQEGESHGT